MNPELIEKYLLRKTNNEESLQIEQWMNENNIGIEDLKNILQLPEGTKQMFSINSEKDWLNVKSKLYPGKQIFFTPVVYRVAAAVGVLAISFILYLTLQRSEPVYLTIANEGTQPREVNLPDGSKIYINKGSQIIYPETFEDTRNVTLTGEAFFDVKRDTLHAFIVSVSQCTIKVLGTSFNILSSTDKLSVVVASGKVAVSSPDKQSVFLEKGEKGLYHFRDHHLDKYINTETNYLSWKTKELQFKNTPLQQVAADLEKFFDVKIELTGEPDNAPLYTSRFANPTLKEVLEEMKLVLSIDYEISDRLIKIKIDSI